MKALASYTYVYNQVPGANKYAPKRALTYCYYRDKSCIALTKYITAGDCFMTAHSSVSNDIDIVRRRVPSSLLALGSPGSDLSRVTWL